MIRKSYSRTGRLCRVTFKVAPEAHVETVSLCGEFNDWDGDVHPLERRKDGSFSVTLSLESDDSYRFRYLLDQKRWGNDDAADDLVDNPFGSQDSVVKV